MSRRVLVDCGGATSSDRADFDRVVTLCQVGEEKNVQLEVTNVSGQIVRELSPLSRDLLDVAAYAYVADTSVSRGGAADVWGRSWTRSFTLTVPVRKLTTWGDNRVADRLKAALSYVTGDDFNFRFVEHPGDEGQTYLDFRSWEPFEGADSVSLFSGGADSLAAAVDAVSKGQRPLLLSHRSAAVLDRRQTNLRDHLRELMPQWTFPHVSVWVHRSRSRPADFSQRSRSFLFLALASVVAHEVNLSKVVVGENGVISMNLPKLEQSFGTRASRSTRPKFIRLFEHLVNALEGFAVDVENPLMLKTKAEVLSIIKDAGVPELIQESVSCAHTMGRPVHVPHCGECSQCVDRRFAAAAADVVAHDLPERYEVDVFVDELKDEGLSQAESHVRAAYRLEAITPEEFVLANPDVVETLSYLPGGASVVAQSLYDLHRRFAKETLTALNAMLRKHSEELVRGVLPEGCLLALAATRHFRRELALNMGERISDVLRRDLPLRFQSEPPTSEKILQDSTEAALASAEENLRREGPYVPYSIVLTVPDFSSEETHVPLFVELKLVKDTASRRYAVKSIGEASGYYLDQGASVLFLVYDTGRHISDDNAFGDEFERKDPERIKVEVVR